MERSQRDRRRAVPGNVLGESTNLHVVRLRLFLALVTMFAIPIAIAAPVIYGLAWGFGASMVVPTLILLALAAALGTVTVWLARRVLEPAERIEEARRILEDAYDRARSESLRDGLTGLGNHRGFQEELERQWAGATRHSAAAGARHHRPRRLQADQRHPRPCRRRPPPSPGGHDDRDVPAPVRPRVPDRRRRVRDHHARHRRGPRPRRHPAAAGRVPGRRSRRARRPRRVLLGRYQRHPGARPGPRVALRTGRRRAVLGQAPRPDLRDGLRQGATRRAGGSATAGRAVLARLAQSRRPVRCARSSSRSTTCRPARRAASRVSSGRWRTAGSPIPGRCSRPPRRPAGRPSSTSPASTP